MILYYCIVDEIKLTQMNMLHFICSKHKISDKYPSYPLFILNVQTSYHTKQIAIKLQPHRLSRLYEQ